MKYFDFNKLDPITNLLTNSSYDDQLFSIDKWFNFSSLVERQHKLEDWLLLIPLSVLVYSWYTMFKWYDKT